MSASYSVDLVKKIIHPMLKSIRPFILAAAALCSVTPAFAGQITIDFEHLPGADGVLGTADDTAMPNTFLQSLDNKFAAIGLIFKQGSLLQDSFYNGDRLNHFISSTNPIATLTQAVNGIRIDSVSYWDATLTAFDIAGNVIATNRLAHPNPGNARYMGSLSVSSAQGIYGFSVLPNNPNYILNLDNLVLTTADAVAEVPEPAQASLFLLGLALVGAAAHKRRKA